MKRSFTIAVLALLLQIANAHEGGISILNIRLNDNTTFRLYVDGREFGPATRMAQLANIRPGKHYIQIYRTERGWGYGYGNGFSGNIVLHPNTESFVTVIPECNKLKFDRIASINDDCREEREPCFYPKPPMVGPGQCGTQPNTVTDYEPMVMNSSDFAQLKGTIDNAGFENTRLTILKQALVYNYLTTQQVRELIDLFWFESSKLEVAKMAYSKTIDPQNYYLVNNHFSFSSSVSQLTNYLAMQ